jgi:hypothetical protein
MTARERRQAERSRRLAIAEAFSGHDPLAPAEQRTWLTVMEICTLCGIAYTPYDARYVRQLLADTLQCEFRSRARVQGKRRAWLFPVKDAQLAPFVGG